ncbi:MAG: hypothetical protein R2867_04315 [Caldilineaceae bacterium]
MYEFDYHGDTLLFEEALDHVWYDLTSKSTTAFATHTLSYLPLSFISDDGNEILFQANDAGSINDGVGYLYDRMAGISAQLKASIAGKEITIIGSNVSGNGKFVIFQYNEQSGREGQCYILELETDQASTVTIGQSGSPDATGIVSCADLSSDGNLALFTSTSSVLVEGDTNNLTDVFIHDRTVGKTSVVSVSSSGETGSSDSGYAQMTSDGKYIFFLSTASNLVDNHQVGANRALFVHDRITGKTDIVSLSPLMSDILIDEYDITDDGRFILFASSSSDVVEGDNNGVSDIFLHDRQTRQTTIVSMAQDGQQADKASYFPRISGDGSVIAFGSAATNLDPNDENGRADIFIYKHEFENNQPTPTPTATIPTPTPTPTEQPCSNCGTVEVYGKVAIWNGEQVPSPAVGVTLQFIWDGRQKTVTTDQNGNYQLFLEPNLYTVTAHKDNHLVVYEVENVDGVMENATELILDVQEDTQVTDFLALPCVSPVTGLNICGLQER